jgi:hypothetical protein
LTGIPFGQVNELSLVGAGRVAHRPFSLCRFKRAFRSGGYEIAAWEESIIKPAA